VEDILDFFHENLGKGTRNLPSRRSRVPHHRQPRSGSA
jgi:hypothetical protein